MVTAADRLGLNLNCAFGQRTSAESLPETRPKAATLDIGSVPSNPL